MTEPITIVIPGPPQGKARARKATDQQLIESYSRTGSVWKTGAELGMRGSSAHERLMKLGVCGHINIFSEFEIERLRSEYEIHANAGTLDQLALSMGRTRQFICRQAAKIGLTDRRRSKAAVGERTRGIPRWNNPNGPPHPRGALGMNHSKETRAAIGKKSKLYWATCKTFGIGLMSEDVRQRRSDQASARAAKRPASNNYSRTKGGIREDIGGMYFRSSWEANYARYLNLLIKMRVVERWEYEPDTFWFESIRRGVRSYKPDFKVQYKNEAKPTYIEIKGWMDAKSKTKIARFKKYYPQHRLEIVAAKEYKNLTIKWASAIPTWEKVS